MNKTPYTINLAASNGLSEITTEQQDFAIAEDFVSTIVGLFWLIKKAVTSENTSDNLEIENDDLSKSLEKVARLGFSVADQLTVVISKIEDSSRRAK